VTRRQLHAAALFCVVAILCSGCQWVLPALSNPGTSSSPLQIVSPVNRSIVTGLDTLAIDVRLGSDTDSSSLSVVLESGNQHRELTWFLTFGGGHAVARVPVSTLPQGLTVVRASADVDGLGRTSVNAVVSNEPGIAVEDVDHCEILGQPRCALPFPSNHWTAPDATTDTGLHVALDVETLPASDRGAPFDPTAWNRNDGFSPGAALLAFVPGIDLAASNLPPIGDMAAYAEPDAGVVVIDADTGERWPVWAELDATATTDETRALIIRPARNFLEGHRYIVALRNLVDTDGQRIQPDREFAVFRNAIPTFIPAIENRRPAMRDIFKRLRDAGVTRSRMYLAWDFTVASERNLSERVLHMRDAADAALAGEAPTFTVTSVENEVSDTILRRVRGTVDVPLFLTGTGEPGSQMNFGADGLPAQNGTFAAPFVCNIPRSVASTPVTPGRALVYGHGLLGSGDEVNGHGSFFNEYKVVGCATDWIGMSENDVPNVLQILRDLSKFPSLADRLQQSLINFQFLAKAMKDPRAFASDAAFRAGTPPTPVIATGEVFFNGNSQGGIAGGAATAISKEWTRAVLGVPGANYSTLLTRSIDWDPFSSFFFASYSDELARPIQLSAIQMLWDRGEANGYAHHLTDDPLPGTPAHQVLLVEAFGDHQVANIATETEARTAGIKLATPALAPGRSNLDNPFFALEPVPSDPYDGSVLVVWDFGTPAPPLENLPNRAGDDPHGKARFEPRAVQQVDEFLRTDGFFTDHCGGDPCQSNA
jgi:hypothetical protein